jgi:hypothetical protein
MPVVFHLAEPPLDNLEFVSSHLFPMIMEILGKSSVIHVGIFETKNRPVKLLDSRL